ncbi:YozE family protein [Streptomyces sp. NBRC 109706]|uniref:YozE family protein n=1 Tax=Streptomyces sp. NBRC 109706 TaxID=1550035 RepID=UPI0007833A04|nr:YozE family protein [Streptomyces sp. NBRC 109706]
MPKPKSFTAWLKTHAGQSNAIGDLAKDVAADPDWPSRKGLAGQRDYLEERGAIPAAIETLERAWSQYEGYRTVTDSSPQ